MAELGVVLATGEDAVAWLDGGRARAAIFAADGRNSC
jgi:hypothetical protein